MKKIIFTLLLAIVSSVWMMSEASEWCMSVAQSGRGQNIRIGGTFHAESMPCEADTLPCPPCLTIALKSGGMHYLVSNDPQIVAILDTITIGSFAIIEGNHYLEGHVDFINVTNIIFPQTDIQQLSGEWEISRETVSTPTGDGGTRWFSTHDVNYTNYVLADDLIYKVILDQSSGYAHYSDAVPYTVDRKEDGTWLLTAEGLFSSSDPVEEGIPSPVTIYRLTEDEMEWMYAANGGDEGPNYYYQHLKRHKQKEDKLPSICDEWNVLSHSMSLGPEYESFKTLHFRLTSDTIINETRYVKLEQDGTYKGALREGTNADIYYVPNHSTNEYLLYAFNAQVGDSLENLWFGANEIDRFIIKSATVVNIESTMPRKFTIGFEWQSVYSYAAINDTSEIMHAELVWLEGLGFQYGGPLNYECPFDCAGAPGMLILCAYKNGEHIYTSDFGEQYGCEYNYDPYLTPDPMFPSDTRWHYVYEEMYGGPDFTRIYFSDSPIDTIINNTHYQRIKGKLFRSEGAKVWCAKDSMGTLVERLVYDFDLQVGDSIRNIFYEDDPYDVIPSYAKVTKVENITLSDGRSARRLSYDAFRYDDIEHIGSLDGFLTPLNLPESNCGCGDHFQCCTRGDFLLFEIAKGACDTFMEDNHPYVDTIPLYLVKDGPGTSTVDPVDPNLIYALLQREHLFIRDFSGAEIYCTLVNKSIPANSPRRVRLQTEPFKDSLAVEITDAGVYEINLTSETWDYTVIGSFTYHIEEGISFTTPEQPSAQKIIRDGQILIRRGEKIYTLQGQQLQ